MVQMTYDAVLVPMEDIFSDDDFNCRGAVIPGHVLELAKSIEDQGLQTPITVQPWNKDGFKYRIVCGHRRYLACSINKFKEIPCYIRKDLDEVQAWVLNLQENLQRQDLNILQEAKALARFQGKGWLQKDICRVLDQPERWVSVRLKLLELPEPIQEKAAAGMLTQYQINEISQLATEELQFEATRRAIDHKLAEGKALKILKKKSDPRKKKVREVPEIEKMQDLIRETLGDSLATRVLGWSAGYVSTEDVFKDIADLAKAAGKNFNVPSSLEDSLTENNIVS